jgi:uncharacterized protein (UPF0248 family)
MGRVQPIHELLSRIRWDPTFAHGQFEIAYADHVLRREVRVPLVSVQLDVGRPGMIGVIDPDGVACHIPLHRIRKVYRDGELVWQRPEPPDEQRGT